MTRVPPPVSSIGTLLGSDSTLLPPVMEETRARVWDRGNQKWRPKCVNFHVCKGGIWPTDDKHCCDCMMGCGVPYKCIVVAAPSYCCICLEDEEAHMQFPCGHKIGAKCARKFLFAEPNLPDPTPQHFGCPPTEHLDDDAAEAVEDEWRANDSEAFDAYNNLSELIEGYRQDFRNDMREKLKRCLMCRASTGVE